MTPRKTKTAGFGIAPKEEPEDPKLAKANYIFMKTQSNPWSPSDVDKLEFADAREFKKMIEACRFFYRRDPLAASVVNKMVDIGINGLALSQGELTDNEFRVFEAILPKLQEFAEAMALEFLLSGLVFPEVHYDPVRKEVLKKLGIKKYTSLVLPTNMWLRDPKTIIIEKNMLTDEPTYFVEIPDDMIYFIQHGGKYEDGNEDPLAFEKLKAAYPRFVSDVVAGKTKVIVDGDLAIRRKVLSDTAYPISYLYPAIESMKHKRNLRRMDYSLASRAITAIMLVKLGYKDFPLLEKDGDEQLNSIRTQLAWRDSAERDIERIYTLYGNHTLDISWVFPPLEVLMSDTKYRDVNQDIIFALGFPRVLITGEAEKSNASDAQYASMSPVKTMENMRMKIINILEMIVERVSEDNKFASEPDIIFEPLQLVDFAAFVGALGALYESGNISRTSYSKYFGYDWDDEVNIKEKENKILKDKGLEEFAPLPNSRAPEGPSAPGDNPPKDTPANPAPKAKTGPKMGAPNPKNG
jgi:hypothetical protein